MSRRVVLHIGAPKCGSTYLQRVMLRNSASLSAAGVNYPHNGDKHPGNAAEIGKLDSSVFEAMFENADTVILSHEDLLSRPESGEALTRFVVGTGTDLIVLAFLRPFSDVVFGDYSQFMKQYFETYLAKREAYDGQDFANFAQARRKVINTAGFLVEWAKQVAPKRPIIARHTAIRPSLEPFLNAAEIDWRVPRDVTNPSLRMEDCDRIAHAIADRSIAPDNVREMFREAFKKTGLPDDGKTVERRALVTELFDRQAQQLKATFGFDVEAPAQ
ncbi:hypothetical protein QKW60_20530 [Defluviimonas aestuarii]|uniref:hypothetical protein n=1 Tax=Albidovulum aestuarii TaxID=1130726 RepID=UPI00249C0C88|nr:hypothetical protein [Defluviimonas aestuarii]MDI3338805.1 hypothetical protein [Defluviimonas aestuarii]